MNIGIIGVGNMGEKHLRVLSKFKNIENIYVSDTNKKRGREISKKYNVVYIEDYKQILTKNKIDAVTICVPTFLHYKVGSYFINQGIHTFIEKPITNLVLSAKKLIENAKEKNVLLMVGHVERYNPAVRKVKKMIEKGEIGDIIAIISRRVGGIAPQVKDVNIAIDLAIHDIDICNYLLDDYPTKTTINMQRSHREKLEDSVEIFMKYKKSSAYVQANWISPVKIRVINITGTKGYIEVNYISQIVELYKNNEHNFKKYMGDFSEFILRFANPEKIVLPIVHKEPLAEELKDFLRMVKNGKRTDSAYAVNALKIATSK